MEQHLDGCRDNEFASYVRHRPGWNLLVAVDRLWDRWKETDGGGASLVVGARLALLAVTTSKTEQFADQITERWRAALDVLDLAKGTRSRSIHPLPQLSHVAWSPDGARFAVSDETRLTVLPAAGGTGKTVYEAAAFSPGALWSPDGTRLLAGTLRFRRPEPQDPSDYIYEIAVVPADGGPASRFTVRDAVEGLAWSPDGRRIAYLSDSRIVTSDPDGQNSRILAEGEAVSISRIAWATVR